MGGNRSSSIAAQLGVIVELRELLEVTTDTADAARAIVAAAVRATTAQAALIAVTRAQGTIVEVIASQGYDPEMIDKYGVMPIEMDSPACRVARSGTELWLSSPREYAAAFPRFYSESANLSHTRSTAYVPLLSGGSSIGALGVGFGHDTQPAHGDAVTLRAIAGFSAVWLAERSQRATRRRRI